MGNVAVTVRARNARGAVRSVLADITGSSAYAAGGDTMVTADIQKLIGANSLAGVALCTVEPPLTGHWCVLDRASNKVKFFTSAGAEASGNISTVTVRASIEYGQATG
jgi:hypothetical protein